MGKRALVLEIQGPRQIVCREGCMIVFGFCYLLSVTSRKSYCPSKKSHYFPSDLVPDYAAVCPGPITQERRCMHLQCPYVTMSTVCQAPWLCQHRGRFPW